MKDPSEDICLSCLFVKSSGNKKLVTTVTDKKQMMGWVQTQNSDTRNIANDFQKLDRSPNEFPFLWLNVFWKGE